MSQQPVLYPYLPRYPALGPAGLAPLLPVIVAANGMQASLHGLLDSGASTNILPRTVGDHLGFDWAAEPLVVAVGGAFGSIQAKLITLTLSVSPFAPVVMPFAWLPTDAAPLLLGQVTFFDEFDVCFFRRRGLFQIQPAQGP